MSKNTIEIMKLRDDAHLSITVQVRTPDGRVGTFQVGASDANKTQFLAAFRASYTKAMDEAEIKASGTLPGSE